MRLSCFVVPLVGALTLVAGSAEAVVTNSSTPNVAVAPDNGCTNDDGAIGLGAGGITDTITFTETGTISDVDVQVEFTQTWRGDIQAALSYDGGGSTVLLVSNHGGSADDYFATFDSDSAVLCSDASNCGGAGNCTVAPGPVCAPDQSLDAFDGLTAPGTFTLSVCDRAAGDTGDLVAWSITLDGSGDLPVELSGFSIE